MYGTLLFQENSVNALAKVNAVKDSGDVFFRTAEATIQNVYSTQMH